MEARAGKQRADLNDTRSGSREGELRPTFPPAGGPQARARAAPNPSIARVASRRLKRGQNNEQPPRELRSGKHFRARPHPEAEKRLLWLSDRKPRSEDSGGGSGLPRSLSRSLSEGGFGRLFRVEKPGEGGEGESRIAVLEVG